MKIHSIGRCWTGQRLLKLFFILLSAYSFINHWDSCIKKPNSRVCLMYEAQLFWPSDFFVIFVNCHCYSLLSTVDIHQNFLLIEMFESNFYLRLRPFGEYLNWSLKWSLNWSLKCSLNWSLRWCLRWSFNWSLNWSPRTAWMET